MKLTALIFLASSMVALAAPTGETQHLATRGDEKARKPVQLHAAARAAGHLLDQTGVNYMVAGGAAMVFHGVPSTPRKTGDVDVFVSDGFKRTATNTLATQGFRQSGHRLVFLADGVPTLFSKTPAKVEVPMDIGETNLAQFTRPAKLIKGVKVINLLDLLNLKCRTSRPPTSKSGQKDVKDMKEITLHLKKKGTLTKANYEREVPGCASEVVVRTIMGK